MTKSDLFVTRCTSVSVNVKSLLDPMPGNSQAQSKIVRSAYIRQKHTSNKINLKFRVTIIVVATHTKQESAAINGSTKQRRAMYETSCRALDRWRLTLHRTNGLTRTGLRLSGTLGHRGQNFKFWPMPNPFLHLISLSLSFPPLNRPIKYS